MNNEIIEARKKIAKLKDDYRLFVGRVCSKLKERGATPEEIADITGLKESAIRSVYFKSNDEETNKEKRGGLTAPLVFCREISTALNGT